MKIRGDLITFNSKSSFFSKEISGVKPNTVRVVNQDELVEIFNWWRIYQNHKIQINEVGSTGWFIRKVIDITEIGEVCGKYLVVISWGVN